MSSATNLNNQNISIEEFYQRDMDRSKLVIAAIYASIATSSAMIAIALMLERDEDFLNFLPFALTIFALWKGAQWFLGLAQHKYSGFWQSTVLLNAAIAVWAVAHVYFEDCPPAEVMMLFSFITFTQLTICAALIYVPRAIDMVLLTGVTACLMISLISGGKVPLESVVMFGTTSMVMRYLLLKHKQVVDVSFCAHRAAMKSLGELEIEKKHVHEMAYKDALTGLNNRRFLLEQVPNWAIAPADDSLRVLMMFDLNGFKRINDTSGHASGDAALVEVARRLKSCLRDGEIPARLGGDEFAALIQVSSLQELESRRLEFGQKLNGAFNCGCRELPLSAACGYTILDTSDADFGASLKKADFASYKAKVEKLAECGHLYSAEDAAEQKCAHLRLRSVEALIKTRKFQSVFQPIVGIGEQPFQYDTFGYEALSRWPNMGGGYVAPPEAFIIVDEQGMTLEATRLLLEDAIAQRQDLPVVAPLFFNFSNGQFRHELVWKNLEGWLRNANFDPASLVIEISEHMVVDDLRWSYDTLKAARDMGIRFALDDFGTGNTGLAMLADFKFEYVKIDKQFFGRSKVDPSTRIVLKNLVRSCNSIGSQVIIEGIETDEDLSLAKSLGARLMQGYHFGKPMSAGANEAIQTNLPVVAEPGMLRLVVG